MYQILCHVRLDALLIVFQMNVIRNVWKQTNGKSGRRKMSDKEKPYIPIFTKEKFELEKLKNNDLTNFNIFIKSLCEKRNMMIDFEISNAIQSVLSKYGIKTDQISIIEIAQTILILIDHKIDTPEKVYEYIVKHNELQDKATPRRKQKIRAKQYDGYDMVVCNCGRIVDNSLFEDIEYCPYCGQKIDWRDTDD